MSNVSNVSTEFSASFLAEVEKIARRLNVSAIEEMAALLANVRECQTQFFTLGAGGSAASFACRERFPGYPFVESYEG